MIALALKWTNKVSSNAITRFEGTDADVTVATRHYEFVGSTYGIDTYHVHSWHAGIHPGCQYGAFPGENMERWGGVTFGNPRLLHVQRDFTGR